MKIVDLNNYKATKVWGLKPCSCAHLHPGANLHTGANIYSGANLHPLTSRSYANKLCPYAPRFDKKLNTRYSFLRKNSLCFFVLSRCVCVLGEGDFLGMLAEGGLPRY